MGTSTRWAGPGGKRWSAAARRLSRWRPDQQDADQQLEEIARDHVRALHQTMQADRSAFGLYSATCGAGSRLADTLKSLAEQGVDSPDAFVARLISEVGGTGGTLADAAVRRAAAAAGRIVLKRPDAADAARLGTAGNGFTWDILCDLYQVFFANVVAEFLRSVVAEQVKLTVPVLVLADPEGRIADLTAEMLVDLVPNPCAASADATELAKAVHSAELAAETVHDHSSVLPDVARRLVPGAAGKVLGLITEEMTAHGEAA